MSDRVRGAAVVLALAVGFVGVALAGIVAEDLLSPGIASPARLAE